MSMSTKLTKHIYLSCPLSTSSWERLSRLRPCGSQVETKNPQKNIPCLGWSDLRTCWWLVTGRKGMGAPMHHLFSWLAASHGPNLQMIFSCKTLQIADDFPIKDFISAGICPWIPPFIAGMSHGRHGSWCFFTAPEGFSCGDVLRAFQSRISRVYLGRKLLLQRPCSWSWIQLEPSPGQPGIPRNPHVMIESPRVR